MENIGNPDVGDNVLEESWIADSPYWRRVARIGLAGSTAHGDSSFNLYYGDRLVAEVQPTTVGANKVSDDDMIVISSKMLCPPNTKIRLVCTDDPPDTNDVYLVIDVQEIPRFARFRRYRRRRY